MATKKKKKTPSRAGAGGADTKLQRPIYLTRRLYDRIEKDRKVQIDLLGKPWLKELTWSGNVVRVLTNYLDGQDEKKKKKKKKKKRNAK